MSALLAVALLLCAPAPVAAEPPVFNYRGILVTNRSTWSSEAAPEFSITTLAIGVEFGTSPTTGVGLIAAGALLAPLRMVLVDGDPVVAELTRGRLSVAASVRAGVGYGYPITDRFRVMPGITWGVTASSFYHQFPAGADSYREVMHGPGVELEAGFELSPTLSIEAGGVARWDLFQVRRLSSAPADRYRNGYLAGGYLGVRSRW